MYLYRWGLAIETVSHEYRYHDKKILLGFLGFLRACDQDSSGDVRQASHIIMNTLCVLMSSESFELELKESLYSWEIENI